MTKHLILLAGLLSLLTACASSPQPATPAPTPAGVAAPELAGTRWTVSHIVGTATLEDHAPSIAFTDDTVSGSATCNRFTGGYRQDGASLVFTPVASTQMMCADDDWMTQEAAFLAALGSSVTVRAADRIVELLDADQRITLTLYPVEDKPLEGTTWQLSGIVTATALTSPADGSTVTMKIADSMLSGKACNSFSGPVATSPTSFKAGPLRSTKMACKTKELTAQETTVLKLLEAATAASIDGSELALTAEDGTGLRFTATE